MPNQLHFSDKENRSLNLQSGWTVALSFVFILYVAVRLWRLTSVCLWFDEIFSVHAARHGFSDLFSFVAQDLIHPPLFYLLLKFWTVIGGESLLWLRLFPVLWAAVAIVPFWLLCRELRLPAPTIVLALSLLTINGSLIKYAQEVRMYSLLFCLSLFSFWLFVKFFNSQQEKKTLIALSIVNLLLIYTHYFGWLIVITELVFFILYGARKRKEFFFSFLFMLLCFAPWTIAVFRASHSSAGFGQNLGWAAKPNFQSLIQLFLNLNQPFYFPLSNVDANFLIWITPPVAIICFGAFVFLCFDIFGAKQENKRPLTLLLFILPLPVALAFIASYLLPYSVWGARHLIIVFAPYAILVAVALQTLRPSFLKDVTLWLVCGFALFAFFGQLLRQANQPVWCAWESLALQRARQGERQTETVKIYATEELIAYHFWFALSEKQSAKFQIAALKNIPGVKEDAAYFLPRGFNEVNLLDAKSVKDEDFWLAFRDSAWQPQKEPLKFFTDRGYGLDQPIEINVKGTRAFLVHVRKKRP
jgi:uncharacterized membrane protein